MVIVLGALASAAGAAGPAAPPWDLEGLFAAPKVYAAADRSADDVTAVFYEGLPWKGNPTRVFAYYAVPDRAEGEKVPAMVLVHGGGGSAFIPWVRLWVERGYAAIAMDTCGCVSSGGYRNHPRHDRGGPPGWGGFDQVDQPVRDQWTYHAVADVILAHSLIRSLPRVDPDRTGLTGISWGGYLACIVAGVDHRFRFAAPVYGCGFLGENSAWLGQFEKMGREKADRWLALWDPSRYLPTARMPMLWVTGTNDFAYPMDSLQKSYRQPKGPRWLSIRPRMPHGHGGPGENPEEIRAMADWILRDGKPLPRITDRGRDGRRAWAAFESPVPVAKAVLHYTRDAGPWKERKWQEAPAALDAAAGEVSAELPEGTAVYCLNLTDARGLVVSSEHEAMRAPDAAR
jgi:dienelactone hydrolase